MSAGASSGSRGVPSVWDGPYRHSLDHRAENPACVQAPLCDCLGRLTTREPPSEPPAPGDFAHMRDSRLSHGSPAENSHGIEEGSSLRLAPIRLPAPLQPTVHLGPSNPLDSGNSSRRHSHSSSTGSMADGESHSHSSRSASFYDCPPSSVSAICGSRLESVRTANKLAPLTQIESASGYSPSEVTLHGPALLALWRAEGNARDTGPDESISAMDLDSDHGERAAHLSPPVAALGDQPPARRRVPQVIVRSPTATGLLEDGRIPHISTAPTSADAEVDIKMCGTSEAACIQVEEGENHGTESSLRGHASLATSAFESDSGTQYSSESGGNSSQRSTRPTSVAVQVERQVGKSKPAPNQSTRLRTQDATKRTRVRAPNKPSKYKLAEPRRLAELVSEEQEETAFAALRKADDQRSQSGLPRSKLNPADFVWTTAPSAGNDQNRDAPELYISNQSTNLRARMQGPYPAAAYSNDDLIDEISGCFDTQGFKSDPEGRQKVRVTRFIRRLTSTFPDGRQCEAYSIARVLRSLSEVPESSRYTALPTVLVEMNQPRPKLPKRDYVNVIPDHDEHASLDAEQHAPPTMSGKGREPKDPLALDPIHFSWSSCRDCQGDFLALTNTTLTPGTKVRVRPYTHRPAASQNDTLIPDLLLSVSARGIHSSDTYARKRDVPAMVRSITMSIQGDDKRVTPSSMESVVMSLLCQLGQLSTELAALPRPVSVDFRTLEQRAEWETSRKDAQVAVFDQASY